MTVERLSAARKRRPPIARSHEEIYDLVGEAKREAADAVGRTDQLHLVTQRVEDKLDKLLKLIGSEGEDEHGHKVGTGAIGRLMRLETEVAKRFGLYDGWTKLVTGFCAAFVLVGGVVWWILSDRLGSLLRPH